MPGSSLRTDCTDAVLMSIFLSYGPGCWSSAFITIPWIASDWGILHFDSYLLISRCPGFYYGIEMGILPQCWHQNPHGVSYGQDFLMEALDHQSDFILFHFSVFGDWLTLTCPYASFEQKRWLQTKEHSKILALWFMISFGAYYIFTYIRLETVCMPFVFRLNESKSLPQENLLLLLQDQLEK